MDEIESKLIKLEKRLSDRFGQIEASLLRIEQKLMNIEKQVKKVRNNAT